MSMVLQFVAVPPPAAVSHVGQAWWTVRAESGSELMWQCSAARRADPLDVTTCNDISLTVLVVSL